MVVDQSDHAVSIPAVQGLVVEHPVAKDREVVGRVTVTADHPLELTRDVLDPERGVQPSLRDNLPCQHSTATNLARQKEALLANGLGKLTDRIAKGSQRLYAHVFGCVNAETVDIGIGDPEAIDDYETRQCRGDLA